MMTHSTATERLPNGSTTGERLPNGSTTGERLPNGSTIALEHHNGTVQQIYCHWDGHLEHNGEILSKHYSDTIKVQQLMNLGDLSGLHPELGEKHDFDDWDFSGCRFYGRDRGEKDTQARTFKSFEDYCQNSSAEEYNYIMRNDGKSYVWFNDPSKLLSVTPSVK